MLVLEEVVVLTLEVEVNELEAVEEFSSFSLAARSDFSLAC